MASASVSTATGLGRGGRGSCDATPPSPSWPRRAARLSPLPRLCERARARTHAGEALPPQSPKSAERAAGRGHEGAGGVLKSTNGGAAGRVPEAEPEDALLRAVELRLLVARPAVPVGLRMLHHHHHRLLASPAGAAAAGSPWQHLQHPLQLPPPQPQLRGCSEAAALGTDEKRLVSPSPHQSGGGGERVGCRGQHAGVSE